jgi:hypothetical protein
MSHADKLKEPLGPMAWGLSRTFVASLSRTLLFDTFPDRVDPRDWMDAGEAIPFPDVRREIGFEEFWFDFVADLGDSQRATYSIAYLFHGPLFIDDKARKLEGRAPSMQPASVTARDGDVCLPMGAFLLCGGDLAYPVADDATLRQRLVAPMNFARRMRRADEPSRPILAIAGNHDWYDSLDGYNRLLRVPPPGYRATAIELDGYHAVQRASYFALSLPFGWTLWGVDSRSESDIDLRQRGFFATKKSPRLIVALPEPVAVFGEVRDWAPGLLERLGEKLAPAPGEARLYLSGDSHHYSRYALPRSRAVNIVCGLGGASLHPPRHDRGSLNALSCFPDPRAATKDVLRRTLNPFHMIAGSGFAPFGILVGAALGAALADPVSQSARLWSRLAGTLLGAIVRLPAAPLDGAPGTLISTALTLAVLIGLFLLYKKRAAQSERAARVRSKSRRGAVLGAAAASIFAVALVADAVWTGGLGMQAVLADAAASTAALAISIGMGPLALALCDGAVRSNGARKARVAAIGAVFGVVITGLVLVLTSIAIALIESVAPISGLVQAVVSMSIGASGPEAGLQFLGLLIGALVGTIVVPPLFGLHESIQYSLGNHYTFVGSLATIDRYQAFVRFRLRKYVDGRSELTGFVIGVDEPVADEALRGGRANPAPRASLIDVFVIEGEET